MLGYTVQRGEQLTLDVDDAELSMSSEPDQQTNKQTTLINSQCVGAVVFFKLSALRS